LPGRGCGRGRTFTEQGYAKTSLREIAERLEVTKAALYYHFKSREDIVHSLLDDYFGQVDALVSWAQQQPGTPARRAERSCAATWTSCAATWTW
jgi:AcrR family transcriptional regulator